MAKFQFDVVLDQLAQRDTARVADGSGASNQLADADVGKFVRLKAGSQYGLCAAGDEIEGVLESGNYPAPQDGYNLGVVRKNGRVKVTLDGLQATPGTGTIDVGDYVVCGTVVARGTSLGSAYPKVCKSTDLTFGTTPAVNFPAGSQLKNKWRVVHRYGTTAVGQLALIERV